MAKKKQTVWPEEALLLLTTAVAIAAIVAPARARAQVACIPVPRPRPPPPSTVPRAKRPHIVTILVDDLGFDDTQIHNKESFFTLQLGKLKAQGITLHRLHTFMWCSPTRRSFLSGRLPVHIGSDNPQACSNALPLDFQLLPEKLASAGYQSHFIGKGHLGYQTEDHLPVHRGFLTHVGFLAGMEGYVQGETPAIEGPEPGSLCHVNSATCHDMWSGTAPMGDARKGEVWYSTNYYTEQAVSRIEGANTSDPFWLHLCYQGVHSGADPMPPEEWQRIPEGSWRSDFYGSMLAVVDSGIGNTTAALRERGLWENAIVLIAGDNGGDNHRQKGDNGTACEGHGPDDYAGGNCGMSSNFPLLGRKSSPFEGGTRVAALLAGGLIPAALRSTDSFLLIHISDFYVTFATLAGVDPTDPYTDTNGMVHDVDGIDVWGALMARRTSVNTVTRQRWLPTTDSSLIFDDDSDPQQRRMWKYYGGEGSNDNGHGANRNNRFYKNGTNYEDPFNECIPDGKGGTVGPIVHTGLPREEAKPTSCAVCTAESPCLFEVIGDPMETTNLAKGSQVNASIQQLIKRMEAKLATYSVYMPGDMSAPQLACYRCLNSSEWNAHWQGWAGPCCLRKQLKTDDMFDSEDGVASLSPSLRVWPLPRSQECTVGGTPAALAAGWLVSTPVGPGGAKCASSVLGAALTRYRSILGGGSSAGALRTIKITVSSNSEVLGANTSYGYSISAAANSTVVVIEAKSPYGVAYALETLSQVLSANECTAFHVEDAPSFVHRGLMIDTGRRFYPVDFVERLLEGMAANKMNVLHMHLSEQCFRVQSATFPQLSAAPCLESATNSSNPGAYSQADIRRLVAYARDRGVRIIPEFDLPGHSGAFCTHLKSEGIECCGDQIQDDAAGKSVAVMGRLFEEMGQLFPDKEMHIGCDETKVVPPCTLANTKAFEVAMIRKLLSLGKQPAGWEEVLFTSEAAIGFPSVVVHSWHHTHWEQVVDLGHRAVVSNLEPFYLGDELPAAMWTDISDNVTNATKLASLLGGEVSAWSDEYLGGCMFSSSQDARFAHSVSNYIFPRTAVAAGSFWRWDHRVSTSSKAFAAALSGMQARLRDRGVASCPCTTTTSYNCSQNMLCDEPYCATGANYTCEDYGHGNASWSCHTGRVGLTVTHPINPDFTIPCTTLQDCLRVATWRCSTTFAARGCNAFSMTNNIDPTGGFGAVASFYALINGSTHQSSSDNLWIRNHVGDVLL